MPPEGGTPNPDSRTRSRARTALAASLESHRLDRADKVVRAPGRRCGGGFRLRAWVMLSYGIATCLLADAAETNRTSRLDYLSFRLISERNIFDASRSGRSTRREREPDRRSRGEAFALLGTMSYEKGRFAFFDGTSSDYRKVLQPAGTIAGYKVAEIAANHVTLESTNGQPIELQVGMQMKKRDEAEWQLSGQADSADLARSSATSSEKKEAGPSSGEESDVLKKLMQKREEELKNEKP